MVKEMKEPESWLVRIACLRSEAEAADLAAETALEDMAPSTLADNLAPPVMSFVEDEAQSDEQWIAHIYLDTRPDAALLGRLASLFPSSAGTPPHVERLEQQDWVEMSQSGLAPVTAGRFHIRHRDDDPLRPGLVNLMLPAGRAFGTGNHETTSGCLDMLDRLRAAGHRFGNIADIGTGTGVLAFAAMTLWPRAFAIASDMDPDSITVTRDNMAANGAVEGSRPGTITLVAAAGCDHGLILGRAPYDLVIANILAGPLIDLASSIPAMLADGGSLILAGLLAEQEAAVRRAYARAGCRIAGRIQNGQWVILHLRRRPRIGWQRPARRSAARGESAGYGSW